MKKYGTGTVLPQEEGDGNHKLASDQKFTDEDRKALEEELAQDAE